MSYKKWLPYPEVAQEVTSLEQGDVLPVTDVPKAQDPGESSIKAVESHQYDQEN